MKLKKRIIPWLLVGAASASPLLITIAEEPEPRSPDAKVSPADLKGLEIQRFPDGTVITEELNKASRLIESKLINPINFYSNQFARMSRAGIRRDSVRYNYAFTDTSESLLAFEVYQGGGLGREWVKIASGVCHPGMESVKVAMPKTGEMVNPEKHPVFAMALGFYSKSKARVKG